MSRENSLVSTQWVEDNLDTPNVVVIEVDEDTTAYDKGHIKGSIKLDWTTDLQDPVRRDFVNKEQFEALLSERGVSNDDTVVLYGGNNNWFAAYAYWYFKLYGHQDVKLIDGGRKKWELDSRELTDELPTRAATTYVAQEQDRSIRAFRDEVVAAIGSQNLVDVRSPDEYAGRLLAPAHLPQEQAQRAGHIPTSVNVPWSKNANDDGTFKSDADLEKLYAELKRAFDVDYRIADEDLHALSVEKAVDQVVELAKAKYGGTPDWLVSVADRFDRLTGRPYLPPKWAFGAWISSGFYPDSQERVLERWREARPPGIPGPGEFLQLVINDPWFAWLRPITSLIADIDETKARIEAVRRDVFAADFDMDSLRVPRIALGLVVAGRDGTGPPLVVPPTKATRRGASSPSPTARSTSCCATRRWRRR